MFPAMMGEKDRGRLEDKKSLDVEEGSPTTPSEDSSQASSTPTSEESAANGHIPSLLESYEKQVRPYIDLIDNLRHLGLEKDVPLPSIVVVGDQSAGKSSTLEAISGIQLPRGSGIVTRCPLELRLKSMPTGSQWRAMIKYEDSDREKYEHKIAVPESIEGQIKEAQKILAGENKGISDSLITLEVEADGIPDLTLIDLPGITRVAAEGQPKSIPEQIKNMIKKYVKKEETIILAVVPANVDVETNEALQMAKEVDSRGERTLGVVTKPDLVDRGAEAEVLAVVKNERYMLKKGYTVIKCRGQQAILDKQSLAEATEEEMMFFKAHEHFGQLDESQYGVRNLADKLTRELVNHIKKTLPSLKMDVRVKQESTRAELTKLGVGVPTANDERMAYLMKILTDFTDSIKNVAAGEYVGIPTRHTRLFTRARIEYKTFADEVHKVLPRDLSNAGAYRQKLEQEMTEQRGRELPRFIKYSVCETFIQELVSQFTEPTHECLEKVSQIVSEVLSQLAHQHLGNYPELESKVKGMLDEHRREAHESCEGELQRLLDMETAVFTQDKSYQLTLELIEKEKEEQERAHGAGTLNAFGGSTPLTVTSYFHVSDSDLRRRDAERMYDMIKAYMEVCERRLTDMVPMNITYYLLRELVSKIRLQIMALCRDDETAKLLQEKREVYTERASLRSRLDRLTKASKELAKF